MLSINKRVFIPPIFRFSSTVILLKRTPERTEQKRDTQMTHTYQKHTHTYTGLEVQNYSCGEYNLIPRGILD